MTTYLNLVNTVLDEAKITLDPLTPATFANPPRTEMYNRVKRWVNEAYIELLTTRNEWFSRKERAVVSIGPRVHLTNLLVPPAVGYVYRGRVSEIDFVVRAIHNQDEVIEGSTNSFATLTVEAVDDEDSLMSLAPNEPLDIISPAPTVNAARYKGVGMYDLAALADNAESIDHRTVTFMPTNEEYLDTQNWFEETATFVDWRDLNKIKSSVGRVQGGPVFITRNPQGTYMFFPPLDRRKLIGFDYTRAYTRMEAHDSTPIGIPEKYQQWIVWRAIMAYGDFQQNSSIWSRGDRNAERIMNIMERDNAEEIRMGVNIW